jgi:hypothetical protein
MLYERPLETLQPTTMDTLNKRETAAQAIEKSVFDGRYDADSIIVTISIALALYNTLEMALLISTTFKKYKGLYFWSLTLCTLAVALYAIGMALSYFELCVKWLHKTVLDIGWLGMIVFQSLVLYSRLGLIFNDFRLIAAVKWMIIFTSIFILVPVIALDFGSSYSSAGSWADGYFYIEKIQLTLITLQELIISLLYVFKTTQLLRIISRTNTRSMIWQLFFLNVIIISMDVAIVALEYLHYQLYQETIKVFVYSVKLKLEIHILSKLVDLVGSKYSAERSMTLDVIDSNAIEGQAREDVRREMELPKTPSLGTWYGTRNEKDLACADVQDLHLLDDTRPIRAASKSSERDEISRVVSNQSSGTARTRGRESDMLYADMLRSITRD